tara:strand:+ start:1445 stop:2287 length:843 start_codon:yes stop_codon:yes gene_type:complete
MSETDNKEQCTDNTLKDMIPIIIVLGVLLLFCLVVLILVNFNGQNLLISLFNTAIMLPANLQKGIDILNNLIEKDIKYKFIFSVVNVVIFIVFNVIFLILTQKNENNCNILSLFYNISYIYFIIVFIISNFSNINYTQLIDTASQLINKNNIVQDFNTYNRFLTNLLFIGTLIQSVLISLYCDKFNDIGNILFTFSLTIGLIITLLSIITTKNYNRLFQDISIIGLIIILFIFIFIFKNSIKCLHLEKHEFYIFTIVIVSSIVLLNLINIIKNFISILKK